MITFFPVGAWRGTVEPNNPCPLWPPHSLFTLLLIQHQMVMDSHRTSMESVFSTRQCLWGTQMEANVVVSAFRLCRLTGRDHRDTRKRMSHRYLTGGEVKQDAYCKYMGRWRHSQGVAFHLYNIGRLTVLRCKGNWYNGTRGIFFFISIQMFFLIVKFRSLEYLQCNLSALKVWENFSNSTPLDFFHR